MKKFGALTTSLLLTASLLVYSGRFRSEAARPQFHPQQWIVQIRPPREWRRRIFRLLAFGSYLT